MTKKRKPLGPLQKLQQIYDWELNARIDWFWDGGFDVALGDDCNGWIDKASFESLSDAIGWLYKRAESFRASVLSRELAAPETKEEGE